MKKIEKNIIKKVRQNCIHFVPGIFRGLEVKIEEKRPFMMSYRDFKPLDWVGI